ncbi:hypothetical protein [Kribbella sp. NPDC000426]|uniref:hypothetical protein n=1 Tax=Kribbella sp. NPDC000426 TaxID=3154255 RepID=UPI00332E9C2E
MDVHPVDQARWDDLVELFGPSGATRGCWCMARRLPPREFGGSDENRAALEGFVQAGMPVGLIGYVDGRPAAWCAVAPRPEYYAIVHSRTLPIDDPDDDTIWAVNCLFVKRGYRGRARRRGLSGEDDAGRSGARRAEHIPRRRIHAVRRASHPSQAQRRRTTNPHQDQFPSSEVKVQSCGRAP